MPKPGGQRRNIHFTFFRLIVRIDGHRDLRNRNGGNDTRKIDSVSSATESNSKAKQDKASSKKQGADAVMAGITISRGTTLGE